MADPARTEPHAPLVWANVLMFVLTFAAAAILVPWYGADTTASRSRDWVVFVVFTGRQRHGRSRPATTACGRTAPTRRTGACGCCSWCSAPWRCRTACSSWCSGHRTHHLHVDDVDRDPYSARRGFWFSHIGWMLREYPSGRNDFSQHPGPEARPDAGVPAPLLRAARARSPTSACRCAAGLAVRRRVGDADPRRRAAPGVEPPRHLLHQLAGAHVGQAVPTPRTTARATTRCSRSSRTARAITTSTTSSPTTTATACAGGSGIRPSG